MKDYYAFPTDMSGSAIPGVPCQVPADIFEAIGTQVEAGGTFSVKAGVDSQVWRSKAWEDLALRDKSLRVYTVCENGDFWFRVATDSYWMEETNGDNIPGAMERDLESYPVALEAEQRVRPHLLDSEDLAGLLRQQRDFSLGACLRHLVLGATAGPDRQSPEGELGAEGQYIHGGMSGITSRTKRNGQFALYINGFLTRHGACPPSR